MIPPVLQNGLDAVGGWMSGKLVFVSLEVAAFALIVWMILRIVRFRSAKVREAFWLTVLLKPLVAILIAWPISWAFISGRGVIPESTLTSSVPLIEQQAEMQGGNSRMNSEQVIQPMPASDVATEPLIASEPSHTVLTADEISWWQQFNWKQGIAILWFLGCGLMLGRLVFGLRTLNKLRKNSQTAPGWLQQLLSECAKQLNIRSRVELRLSKEIAVPMLFGLLRPVIVLPSWCVDKFSHAELRLMLMHELAHWKYRDTWALLAKQLIEAMFFFHPAVWYAGRQMVKEAETACDDIVVMSSQQSTIYANCLMRIVEHAAGIKRRSSFALLWTGLAAGGTVTGNRIRKLLQHSRVISTKITTRAIIALLLVAVLGLPSVLGDTSKKDEQKPKPAITVGKHAIPAIVTVGKNTGPVALGKNGIVLVEKITDGVYRIGNLTMDVKAMEIIAPGKIIKIEGMIEYLAVGELGKTHEAILVLDVEPIHLQTVLIRLGMKPGQNLRYQGDPTPPEGDTAEIWVEWELNGKRKRHRAEDLVYDVKQDAPMEHTSWVFTGSRVLYGTFPAQRTKSMIATYRDADAIFNNPLPGGLDDNTYRVNSEVVPPEGTEVKLVIKREIDPRTVEESMRRMSSRDDWKITESALIPGNSLEEYEPGAVIWGEGKHIEGQVHISNIHYSGGNFWARGIPAHLEKWMNARTGIRVNLIVHGGKSVYLSWPPVEDPDEDGEDAPPEQIESASESVAPGGLFKQPMLLMSGMREVNLSEAERVNLRKYLIEKGGFLFIDDYSEDTNAFALSIRSRLRLAFPEFPIERIPNNHEIYNIFFRVYGPPLGSISWLRRKERDTEAENYLEGIFIGERLAVVISDRDYWSALIGRGDYSPGVMRFCTNLVVYAVTHGGIADYSRYKP